MNKHAKLETFRAKDTLPTNRVVHADIALNLLESCIAALEYMRDDSRSERRRQANIAGLEEVIARATDERSN